MSQDETKQTQTPPGRNRLGQATSPYLLQHKDNPVHWYPWGDEAIEAARTQEKPIFLSIGYSACHWCHVMEEESFEDEETAALMNEYFICIKVDREERPDLDDIYMTAVQMLTGGGGWPMSVWLTPDLKPYYGGTYFPKDRRHGRPSFSDVLTGLGEAWRTDREKVLERADQIHRGMVEHLSGDRVPQAHADLDRGLITAAVQQLSTRYDAVHGGFGSAPKFPPHMGLKLLLSEHRRTGDENLIRMATNTFDRMARGGIYDQIGGGFHRYSTDPQWLVPHFEKMLYDNALLAAAYVEAWRVTGNEEYRRVVDEIFEWLRREMTSPEGAFYSTLDADSEGGEGKFYVWRPSEVQEVLGKEDAELFMDYYDITEAGNFEDAASIPNVRTPAPLFAERRNLSLDELRKRLEKARARMLAARARRPRPHLDDKILSAWNGLMITALARAGSAFEEPRLVRDASRAAAFILDTMRGEEGLLRVSYREGRLASESFLDDQAFFIEGLLALHAATSDPTWLDKARALLASTDAVFRDPGGQGYFFAPPGQSDLLVRTKNPLDSAIPSGTSVIAGCLVELYRATGDPPFRERARALLSSYSGAMSSLPGGFYSMLASLDAYLASAGPRAGDAIVGVAVTPTMSESSRGGKLELLVRLSIQDGWHINSSTPTTEDLIPTSFTLASDGVVSVESIHYPRGEQIHLGFAGRPISVYQGKVEIPVELHIAEDAPEGPRELEGKVTFQACDDRSCLKPVETPIAFGVLVVP